MNIQTVILQIMIIGMIAIYSHHWEHTDQHQTLTQHVFNTQIRRIVIIGSKGQYTSGQVVHNVFGRCFHNNIAGKAFWQAAHSTQYFLKYLQFFFVRQIAKQKQIGGLFKAISALFAEATHQINDVITAIPQLAIARNPFPGFIFFKGMNMRNIGEPYQYPFPVFIT